MKKLFLPILFVLLLLGNNTDAQNKTLNTDTGDDIVAVSNGRLRGIVNPETGIKHFWGIPFAQPPVGNLRWREPLPPKDWKGIRNADKFGPRPMQTPVYSDMRFRSDSVSEDCLYLNVWTPQTGKNFNLPVLVYFYGGGFIAGDGSEWRYDGESLAQRGIVVVTVNYRLGIFGFFSHPELTKESVNHASGNYGFLDQAAALRWVRDNIRVFGGDPGRVTIGGESAGSFSVSALMASPLSKDLISAAIGESGSVLGPTLGYTTLSLGEKRGVDFSESIGAQSLSELRAIPSGQLLVASSKNGAGSWPIVVDGYFFGKEPLKIFKEGEQAKVPLLVGWNSEEMNYMTMMQGRMPTPENYKEIIKNRFGSASDKILKAFPGNSMGQVIESATSLGSIFFIVYSTWKWAELQRQTGGHPVYQYIFSKQRPEMTNPDAQQQSLPFPPGINGAGHSWEIEYALGNLRTNPVYNWRPDDFHVSAVMEEYFANFIRSGDPNGKDLPLWLSNSSNGNRNLIMDINKHSEMKRLSHPEQLEFIEDLFNNGDLKDFKLF